MPDLVRRLGTFCARPALARALATCLCGLALAGAGDAGDDEVASLVVVTPGIRDGASDQWVGVASQVAPTHDRWVIRQAGVGTHVPVFEADPGPLNTVPKNHIITIRSDATPEQIRRTVHDIAASPHATVIVDMDLNTAGIGWKSETHWAAGVVEAVAGEHLREHPKTRTSWIGHSAGTEPMRMVAERSPSGGRPMFDDIYALSPRAPFADHWPDQTVMLIRDGDFLDSPDGHVPAHALGEGASPSYVAAVAAAGHRVIRQETEGLVNDVGVTMASGHVLKALAMGLHPGFVAHTAETPIATPDQKLSYYAPHATEPEPLGSTPILQGLRTVTRITEARATTPGEIRAQINANNPTPGLGGISLSPTALIPLDPARIDSVGCCVGPGSLVFHMVGNRAIVVSPLPLDVLRAAYDVAYVRGEKAELSIGGAREESPTGGVVSNRNAPGHSSVYYFGRTRDTLLGLAMYEADSALGEMAFGDGPLATAVGRRLPGFRSLPELFPDKYAESPAQDRFLGAQRIFLDAASAPASLSPDGRSLALGPPLFSIRFGRTGPAEAAYGAFLQAHFEEVAASPEGRPFAQLVPYAQALAVFRWLKANHVRVDPGLLSDVQPRRVVTPMLAPETPPARLADIKVRAPTALFGPFGPERIVAVGGAETRFGYRQGRLVSVRRPDGGRLEVLRDGLGAPLALTAAGRSAAFYPDPQAGLILARDVELHEDHGQVTVRFKPTSTYSPLSNPEVQLADLAFRFAAGEPVL